MQSIPLRKSDLPRSIARELTAGLVVFLVAMPLCLGVALASGAPVTAGLISGVIGGVVVGLLSGSQVSVSAPGAGIAAVVAAQLAILGSFEVFLAALVVAGLLQLALGLARAGSIAAFFPTSVVKGLLAAIGIILIIRQVPHLLGHSQNLLGEGARHPLSLGSTFSGLATLAGNIHPAATVIGILSLAGLLAWERSSLKTRMVPAPLIVVILGVALSWLFRTVIGGSWTLEPTHLVQVPEISEGLKSWLVAPDFGLWQEQSFWIAAITLAAVASLESLLNSEAIDNLDPQRRIAPRNRELLAQGVGNSLAGFVGGLPMVVVIARSSVGINAGGQTKLFTITQGLLILLSVLLLPTWLNQIPLACLAAILLVTGLKLASPLVVRRMWNESPSQFVPFAATVVGIVLTDLLFGTLFGMAVSLAFILRSNMRRPVRRYVERHLGGDVMRVELANQVSFLNRAAIERVLDALPRGSNVLLDATDTDYIDPDVLDLIRDFTEQSGPARGVNVSLLGFRDQYQLDDQIQYVDFSSREVQSTLTPAQVIRILMDGNERFRTGHRLTRDLGRIVKTTAQGQHPLAVVLSCMDSRAPVEMVFDLGLGDIFSVRIAGNISGQKVLGCIEYGTAVAGAKLVLVMGHTRCGAVTAAVQAMLDPNNPDAATAEPAHAHDEQAEDPCPHFAPIAVEIQKSVDPEECPRAAQLPPQEKAAFVDEVARRNVLHTIKLMLAQSPSLARLVAAEQVAVAGAIYDITTGEVQFLSGPEPAPRPPEPAQMMAMTP